ncbi:mucin-6-like isoform X2 [Convolutriloba macropyga]|uniref:mucin-6-like isoform X2 n=1 Tax=Convolutriloba macropyga TaxID=536237 RepID=UPI003F525D01
MFRLLFAALIAVNILHSSWTLDDCFGNDTSGISTADFTTLIQDWARELYVEPAADRRFASCMAYSTSHYRTFDGLFYTFEGQCTYTMMSTAGLAVEIDNSDCNEQTCSRKVFITLQGGTSYQYKVTTNYTHAHIQTPQSSLAPAADVDIDLHTQASASLPGIGIDPNRHSLSVAGDNVYFKLGNARVKLGPDGTVVVTLEKEEFFNDQNLKGMCGSYDDNRENDFKNNEDEFVAHASAFANSWKITDYETVPGSCQDAQETTHPCMSLTDAERGAAVGTCAHLQMGPFEHYKNDYGVEMFKLDCVYDYCKAVGDNLSECAAVCDSFMMFAEQCNSKAEGPLVQWRTSEFCPKTCPYPHMEYLECGPSCCHRCNFAGRPLDDSCFEECTPGCFCEPGYFMDENRNCLEKQECPCIHNEIKYDYGEKISIDDCNDCTCDGGQWNCTNYKCDGECHVTGHGHFRTFDGVHYLFPENCEYILAETMDSPVPVNKDFIIRVKTINCVDNGHHGCEKELTIKIKGDKSGQQTIVLTPDTITVDDSPFAGTSKTIDGITVVEMTTNYVGVFKEGFILHYNTHDSRITLKLSPNLYSQEVHGLCGYYDNNPANDMRTKSNVLEADVLTFGHSWIYAGAVGSCTLMTAIHADMCATYASTRRMKAENYCEELLSGESFAECRKILSPDDYHKQCLYDICSSYPTNVVTSCSAMAAYAHECHKYLNETGIEVLDSWTKEVETAEISVCYPSCPPGASYTECAPSCGLSCQAASIGSLERQTCSSKCLSGCGCGPGMLYDEDTETCIDDSTCPCEFPGHVHSFTEGEVHTEGCMNCTCSSGTWKCEVEDMCDRGCPSRLVFKKDVPPCIPTCDTHFADIPVECPYGSIAGLCTCPAGEVLRGERDMHCISPSKCPCQHAGRWYDAGEQISQDCNTCTCSGRYWSCTEFPCHSTCSATGTVHYRTFDGVTFPFHGDCTYILVEDTVDNRFKVEAKNIACGSNNVACTKEVKIYLNTTVITLLRGNDIEVNARRIGKDNLGGLYEPRMGIRVDEPGTFTVVKVDRPDGTNFSVAWDGSMSVYVRVHPTLSGQISGLCGNYNGDVKDDLKSSTGVIETNPDNFANSWKTDGNCPDRINPGHNPRDSIRSSWAEKVCSKLKDDKIFGECHEKINPDSYYDDCVADSVFCDRGGDCGCMCTAIARYARECCNEHNLCPSWREEEFCPYSCGTCHDEDIFVHFNNHTYPLEHTCRQYRVCGPACPLTCQNYAAQKAEDCADNRCYEGCFCKAGYIWDPYSETCVLPEGCPCAYKEPGTSDLKLVGKGFTFYSDICNKCTCHGYGEIKCENDDENPDCGCDTAFEISCQQNRGGKNHTICVSNLYVCDGNEDCEYGEDEQGCEMECEHRCDDSDMFSECYTSDDICDGECDCKKKGDNYCLDEVNCEPCCDTDTHFICPSTQLCIPEPWVCDGEIDCKMTPEEVKSMTGVVVPYLPTDGSAWHDEMNCGCEDESLFQCHDKPKICLNMTKVCDGHDDCGDSSDEPPYIDRTLYDNCRTIPTSTASTSSVSNGWKGKTKTQTSLWIACLLTRDLLQPNTVYHRTATTSSVLATNFCLSGLPQNDQLTEDDKNVQTTTNILTFLEL